MHLVRLVLNHCDENLHARHMSISWSCCRITSVFLGPEFFDPSFSPVVMWRQKGHVRIGLDTENVVDAKLICVKCHWLIPVVQIGSCKSEPKRIQCIITGNWWKMTRLLKTWWLISLSDETYPLITMTTISYYWLFPITIDELFELIISKFNSLLQGLRCKRDIAEYWKVK